VPDKGTTKTQVQLTI